MSRTRRAVATTTEVLFSVLKGGGLALNTLAGNTFTPDHNQPTLIDAIKNDPAYQAEMLNTLFASVELGSFISRAFTAKVWKELTTFEKVSLAALLGIGLTSTGLSYWNLHSGDLHPATSYAGALGFTAFGLATNVINNAQRRSVANTENDYLLPVNYGSTDRY